MDSLELLRLQVGLLCTGGHYKLFHAASQLEELSESELGTCERANQTTQRLVETSTSCERSLRSFGTKMTPKLYQKLQVLLDDSKTKEVIENCKDMADLAQDTLANADRMKTVLGEALHAVPNPPTEKPTTTTTTTTTSRSVLAPPEPATVDPQLLDCLDNIDEDVAELQSACVSSRGSLNLLSAASLGSSLFETARSKTTKAQTLFSQMQTLSSTLQSVASTMGNDGCCAQCSSLAQTLKMLFECRDLVGWLSKVAQAVQRLVGAILDLVQLAGKKIDNFRNEFQAGKKIGSFVKKHGRRFGRKLLGAAKDRLS